MLYHPLVALAIIFLIAYNSELLGIAMVWNKGLQLLKSLRMSGLRRDISHLVLNKQMLVLMIGMLSFWWIGGKYLLVVPISYKHIFLTLLGQSICQWIIRVWHCTWFTVWCSGLSKPCCGEAWRVTYGACHFECFWSYLDISGSQPRYSLWKANGTL